MSNTGKIIRIAANELDELLEKAHEEAWRELVLVGPAADVPGPIDDWPDSWKAAGQVFQLSATNETLVNRLQLLTGLRSLDLWYYGIGDESAKAIAASLRNLRSLDLRGNGIGVEGVKAIAASLKGLTSLTLMSNGIGSAGAKVIAASLSGLTSLDLWGNDIGADGARAIATSLKGLTSLDLGSNKLGAESAKAIAASLPGLSSLNLGGNRIGDEGATAVAASLPRLTSLDLWGNGIGADAAKTIATSLTGLTSLDLSDNEIGDEGAKSIAASLRGLSSLDLTSNRIGVDGAKAIAASLTGLMSLDLWGNDIGAEGAKAIAVSLRGLTSLNLRSNRIGADGAKAIAASLTGLMSLDLWGNDIGAEGAKAIAASLRGLTSLNLNDNQIGDEGTEAIAGSLTGLTSLELWRNGIGEEGVKAIAASLRDLTSLNLNENQIGDEGAKSIAASLTGLTSLDLRDNRIGAEGIGAIATSLVGLTSLDLWRNGIGDEGAKAIAASLRGLTSLNLNDNQIGDEGAKSIAASLAGLTSLDLRSNRVGPDGAKAIAASLTGLMSLDLWNNDIGAEGAKAIAASLRGLTSLNLNDNQIGDEGAKAIASLLTGLTSLNLSDSQIGDEGAKAIAASLRGLTSLNLNDNHIGDEGVKAIAASLTGLTSLGLMDNGVGVEGVKAIAVSLTGLESLDLDDNQIGDEGAKAIAASLTGLTSLDLGINRIGDEGTKAIATSLIGLTSLDLRRNRIGDVGAKTIAAWLTGLMSLDLSFNQIGDEGVKAIAASLTGLTSLYLSNNSIGNEGTEALLAAWSSEEKRGQLRDLNIRGNSDLGGLLPKEVLETTDAPSILAAYRRFYVGKQKATLRPLNELKLLVVGNEAVGKTSLVRYLIADRPRDPNESKTAGITHHEKIDVQEWSPHDCRVRLNVWDFGGQEMMRGTHRFFLTERSLYLLIMEDRRQDDRSIFDWLKTIRNRGGDSPVIVVINKSDDGKQDLRLDDGGLKATYPNVVAFLRTSCDPGDWAKGSIQRLRERIADTIANHEHLKHIQDPIPANWLHVKNRVSELAGQRSVMSRADFFSLCNDPGDGVEPITDNSEQRSLLRLLHDYGTIIAHGLERDAPAARREINLLDPNWLTGAIYRILDRASSVQQEGEFLRSHLVEWLDPVLYPPEWHEFILDMMQDRDLGLCFRLPTLREERYLLPEALPASRRFYGKWPEDSLRFRYVYNYLPPSLIPRFIVQSHQHLAPDKTRWRTGVVLAVRNCEVLVLADVDQRRVDIQVSGPSGQRRGALDVILSDLDVVHALNPEAEPVAAVPLPDRPNVHVGYEHLLLLEQRKGEDYSFFPEGAERDYKVAELLNGVRRDELKLSNRSGHTIRQTRPHLVILVHGIRTHALWQNELGKTLESAGFHVQPTNYGYLDILRFLVPWQLFAGGVIRKITSQVRHALAIHKDADCSVIAHSFGTYVIARILRDSTDLEFNKIIFCGSVVPDRFRFEDYRKRFDLPLVNEVGTRDFWPVMAKVVTFGYDWAGTYGFRRPPIRDRWHNGKTHSDFLTPEFCRKYWVSYLSAEKLVEDDEAAEKPPWWLWVVSTFQLKYVVLIAVVALLWRWFA